nr:MAG TPA: hypothetical protein [Caudoviricetes sp.]
MHFDQISPKAGSQNTHLCLLSHSQHNNIHLQYCSRQPLCVHDRRRGIVLVPPVLFYGIPINNYFQRKKWKR